MQSGPQFRCGLIANMSYGWSTKAKGNINGLCDGELKEMNANGLRGNEILVVMEFQEQFADIFNKKGFKYSFHIESDYEECSSMIVRLQDMKFLC